MSVRWLVGALLAVLILAGAAHAQAPPPLPVVLVPGLNESAGDVSPAAPDCLRANDFATICAALAARGHPVYVVASAPGGAGAVLDNAGAIDGNARALAAYLRALPAPALVVGHSLGGLVARHAIVAEGAPAAGLVTIGTPHTGSFAADALIGGASLPCLPGDAVCRRIRARLRAELATRGEAALRDLTATSRLFANRELGLPGRPQPRAWLVAGTWFSGFDPTGYVFPNDLIVGRRSGLASGVRGLEGAVRLQSRLFHVIRNPFTGMRESPNQFESDLVIQQIAGAAGSLAAGGAGAPAPSGRAASGPLAVTLSTVRDAGRARSGERLRKRGLRLLVADGDFALVCGSRRTPALRSGLSVWVVPAVTIPCARPILRARAPIGLVQVSDEGGVIARVAPGSAGTTITISADGDIARAALVVGRRTLMARRRGANLVLRVPAARIGGDGELTATVAGRPYEAQIPLP